MKIKKRNGQLVEFDSNKIKTAIQKAFASKNEEYNPILFDNVIDTIYHQCQNENVLDVEEVQDIIENNLMTYGYYDIAKAFILYREQHRNARFIRERIDYMDRYSSSTDNAATSSETDPNANVTVKNISNLESEVYKTTNRIIQRQRMKDKLNEMYPEVASQYEKDLEHHIIYTHDEASTPTTKFYCQAVSLYPLMLEGVGNIDGVTPSAPNDLQSFSGQITNLAFLLSSQCKGAIAFGEYFIALNYYAIQEFGKNWYNKLDCIATTDHCLTQRTVRDSICKAFKQFVWGINQPAGNRGYQSPFINISYYDHTYFDSLFSNFYYPDGTQPEWEAIDTLQRMFMKWFNRLRLKQVLTFPVESFAMVHNGKDIIDKEYKELCAEMYAEGHSFFTYISDSADSLASCCYSADTDVYIKRDVGIEVISFKEIKERGLKHGDFKIFSNGKWKTGKLVELPNRQMYKIITSNDRYMCVTDNHRNNCLRGMVLTKDLTTDDYIMVCDTPVWKLDKTDKLLIEKDGNYYARITSINKVEYNGNVFCFEMDDKEDDMFTLASGIHNYNCRLKNELQENTFSPTSGLTGVMTGSCNVITLNINRIIQDCDRCFGLTRNGGWKENYSFIKKYISDILERVYKYHIAFKTMLYELEDSKMFASSNGGYIHMNKLYSTIGINGLNEAARFLGLEVNNNDEYIDFLQLILGTIKEQNKLHSIKSKKRPFLFNSEVVPAEGLGGKNYKWDKEDGYWVPEDKNRYNSYFYDAHDPNTSVIDKFVLHGRKTYQYTDGELRIAC